MFKPKDTLKNIKPYLIDEYYPKCELKLDSNENIFGPSRNVIDAFKSLDLNFFNLYPCYGELINVLSKRYGFDKENILLTNGCDEAINIILSTYLTKEDSILSFSPSFSMPILYSKVIGADCNQVDYIERWEFSKEALFENIKSETKVIYLASPNNPTGDIIEPSIIEDVLKTCSKQLVLLDLTYISYSKYSECDYFNLVKKYENLICVKSFSKDYALAGLRLGFILTNKGFIEEFKKVISPYSVNSMAVYAGIKALEDVEYLNYIKNEVQKSKEYLICEFTKLGFTPYASEANFILVDFKQKCEFAYNKLRKNGIIVRRFNTEMLQNALRIGIPPIDKAKKIIEALRPNKLLVFDLDGVVFDVSNSYRYAIQKTFEYFTGYPCKPCEMQEAKNLGGLSNDWDLTKHLLNKKGVDVDYSKLVEVFQSIFYDSSKEDYKGAIDNEKLVLGCEFFNELSKKYDLAVFTGRPKEEAFYSLKKFGLDKYFQYFVCLEDVEHGRSKPHPDGLLKIKEYCYYTDICFFGDTVDDAKAGYDASVIMYGIIPPNASNIDETIKSLKNFGAADVLENANKILEYKLFKEEKVCR